MDKRYAISEIWKIFRTLGDPSEQEVVTATTAAIFKINNTKLYVPVDILSISYKIKFLENIK